MINTKQISDWVYTNIRALTITGLLSYVVAVTGIFFVEFEANFRSFFHKDSELIQTFDETLNQYEQGETLGFYLKFSNQGQVSEKNIETIQYADAMANTLPYVRHVSSLTSFQKPFSSEDAIDRKFIGDWAEEKNGITEIRQYIQIQPQLSGRLLANDNSGALVIAQLDLPVPLYKSTRTLIKAAEAIAAEIERENQHVEVHITGTAAFDNGLLSEFIRLVILTLPLCALLVTLAVSWVFRSIWIPVAGLTASGLTLSATAGIFGWLPIHFNQTGFVGIVLVLVLVVIDCIHIGSNYVVNLSLSMDKEKAIKESIRANLLPIFYTTLTTSVGLITLFITGSPPFVLFAQIALTGITIGYFFSFIFMTSILNWAPAPVTDKRLPPEPLVNLVQGLVLNKPKQIVVTFAAFSLLALLLIPLNVVDEDTSGYFMPGTDIDKSFELIQKDFKANNQLSINLVTTGNKSIISPEIFLSIEKFEEWLQSKRPVVSTISINDIIRETKGTWENKPNAKTLPQSEEEYGQLLMLYEMSLLAGRSTSEVIAPDRSQTLFIVSLVDLSNRELLDFKNEIKLWWAQHSTDIEVSISGRDITFAQLSEETVNKSIIGGAIVAVLVTLFLIFSFQSIKWGLFSLIPNILPFILLFGFWGLIYGEISQAVCMAFTIVLGIVVDDSIHFIVKFRDAKNSLDIEDAIRKTFQFVGFAITATSIVFIVDGIIIYSTSQFVPNSILAAFLLISITFAWACDLLLMPALLTIYYKQMHNQKGQSN